MEFSVFSSVDIWLICKLLAAAVQVSCTTTEAYLFFTTSYSKQKLSSEKETLCKVLSHIDLSIVSTLLGYPSQPTRVANLNFQAKI